MINESKIPSDKLFFHGSRFNSKLLKINPPTTENIFFVTSDLDYADMYAFDETNGPNIYAITLNKNANVFVPWNRDDAEKLDYPRDVKELLAFENHYGDPIDVFNTLNDIVRLSKTFKEFHMNWQEIYYGYVYKWYHGDHEEEQRIMYALEAVRFFEKKIPCIFEKDKAAEILRTEFCKDLKKAGFQMYCTQELTKNTNDNKIKRYGNKSYSKEKSYTRAESNTCYGIFDVSALDSLYPIPLDKDIVEKAVKELLKNYNEYKKSEDYNKDYSTSNNLLNCFIQEYKKKS